MHPSFNSFSPTGGNSLHAVRVVHLLNTQLATNQVTNLATLLSIRPTWLWPHSYTPAFVACQGHYTNDALHRVRSPFPCKVLSCIQPLQLLPNFCHHLARWRQTIVQSQLTG